jgi:hypothetical protein
MSWGKDCWRLDIMEILSFIFSSFWTFFGIVILIETVLTGIAKIIGAMFSRKYNKEIVELIKEMVKNNV